jgi:anti-anti-sigma factor
VTANLDTIPLRVRVSHGRRLDLVMVGGELDIATAPILTSMVERLTIAGRSRRVVIDVSAVTFVDLHGMRALDDLAAHGRVRGSVEIVPCAALVRLRLALLRPPALSLLDPHAA